MKKALKISALLMALIVMAAFAVVFTFNADDAVKLNNTNLDALKLGGTFELEENIGDITNTEVITLGEKVTIDLKGYTITSGCVEALFNQGKVANPGIIKIIDTVSLFKNQTHRSRMKIPFATILESIGFDMIFSSLDFGF